MDPYRHIRKWTGKKDIMLLSNNQIQRITHICSQIEDLESDLSVKSVGNINPELNDPEEISVDSDKWKLFCNDAKSFLEENKDIPEIYQYYKNFRGILSRIDTLGIGESEVSDLLQFFQRMIKS